MIPAALPALLVLAASTSMVERDVAVPMRDGVVLRADVWRPAAVGRFPTLVYRTPYDRRDVQGEGSTVARAAARGYAVVVQDVRGRYGSEGEFDPYRHEGRDGYDTIEWAAARPWSDGSVGTFGLSYPGAVQWLAAVESPPHLKAMVPAMTFSTPRNFFYSGGVFDLSWTAWIWNNIAPDVRVRRRLSGPRTDEEARAAWGRIRDSVQRRLPLSALDEFRDVAPYLFTWMKHPAADPWWDWAELHGKYERVGAAVLNLSGWHDEAYGPEGAVTNFLGLRAARQGQADPRARLVLGPWVHGSVTMHDPEAQSRSGDRTFGPSAAIDYQETILRFMDRHVRGTDNGLDREPPVRVFVMGEDVWREADRWPLPGTVSRHLYLVGGPAGGAGRLTDMPSGTSGASVSFVSDPARPVEDPHAAQPGAHDYRSLAGREDVAVFETAPLDSDLRVVGAITAELFVSTETRDVDVWARLFDVAPDGTAFNLMSPGLDVVRASYAGGSRRDLLERHRVYPLRFANLMTGNLFRKGHRVRLVVCGSFYPHFSRNLQTGELETVSAHSRPGRVRVHSGPPYASRLTLPVVNP